MGSSQINAERLRQGTRTEVSITVIESCQECQDSCVTALVFSHGVAARKTYRSCLFIREHQELGHALSAVGRWLLGHGSLVTEADNRAWILEHQLTLDVG